MGMPHYSLLLVVAYRLTRHEVLSINIKPTFPGRVSIWTLFARVTKNANQEMARPRKKENHTNPICILCRLTGRGSFWKESGSFRRDMTRFFESVGRLFPPSAAWRGFSVFLDIEVIDETRPFHPIVPSHLKGAVVVSSRDPFFFFFLRVRTGAKWLWRGGGLGRDPAASIGEPQEILPPFRIGSSRQAAVLYVERSLSARRRRFLTFLAMSGWRRRDGFGQKGCGSHDEEEPKERCHLGRFLSVC